MTAKAVAAVALSPREVEILQWILDGKSDTTIGLILGISPKTINFHVENAKRKLGTAQRVRAIALALSAGLLRMPGDGLDDDDPRRARRRPRLPGSVGDLGRC